MKICHGNLNIQKNMSEDFVVGRILTLMQYDMFPCYMIELADIACLLTVSDLSFLHSG